MIKGILKKAAATVLCAAVAIGSGVTAFAAEKTYTIPELNNMSITLPEDMTAATRQSSQNDTYFSLFGADYTNTMTYFQSRDIYLQGKNNTASLVLTVTMTETEESKGLNNLNLLTGERLGEIARNFLTNPDYSACTVDQPGKTVTWLTFDVYSNGNNAFQANTISDGKSIIITMTREGASVTEADYQSFVNIINSVKFGQFAFFEQYKLYIIIGACALVLLILLIVIICIARRAGKRKKQTKTKSENERILEELAGEYSRGRGRTEHEPVKEEEPAQYVAVPSEPEPETTGKYTDSQIDAMLGGEDSGDFTVALPEETEEEQATDDEQITVYNRPVRQEPKPVPIAVVTEPTPQEPDITAEESQSRPIPAESAPAADTTDDEDFFAGVTFAEAASELAEEEAAQEEPEAISAQPVEEAVTEEVTAEEDEEEPISEDEPTDETAEEPPQEAVEETAEEPAKEAVEETAEEPAKEAVEETAEDPKQETAEESAPEEAPTEENASEDEDDSEADEPDELEEYMNDEDLVREKAKEARFRNSNDFFDEAPRKTVGVISSRDIDEAEEYDVIGEVERRATEVEREAPKPKKKGNGFVGVLKKIGAGIGSFFTHCGYFITNLKREIKRSRAKKKRKKAEEERRRRARERAAQQRAQQRQRDDNGLVQVRSRGERPSQPAKRRPAQPTNRKPSQTAKRKPSQTAKRRPPQSGTRRPPNKR